MGFRSRRARVLAPVLAVATGGLLLRAQDVTRGSPPSGAAAATAAAAATQPHDPPGAGGAATTAPSTTAPTTGPAAAAAAAAATTQPRNLSLNFKDAPLDTVLDYLSNVGGFEVIKEGPVDGRVTVLSKQPVTRAEAAVLLSAALKANGFAAVQDGRTLKILPRDKAKKSSIPVHFGADPDEIADTDELITQVIPVRNIDATKLKQDLTPLVGEPGDLTANDGSNTIAITDVSSNIRRLAKIIHAMDLEETTVSEMRIRQLKYAKAVDAVKLIDAVFKSDGGGGGGPQGGPQGMVMGPNGPQPPGGPGGGGGGARRSRAKVLAAADERTNIIVVSGPADMLKVVDMILEKLEANPIPSSIIRPFPLKYADAQTTSKLIDSIFHPKSNNNDDYPFFFRFGGEQQSNKVNVNTAYDDRTNTVIVTAPAEMMQQIEELIHSLDANPVAASDLKIFTLRYADSDAVAKLINSTFNPSQDQDQNASRFFRYYFYGQQPEEQRGAKVNANSDFRTNTVVVTAPRETMKVIDAMIHQLDANPASEDTLFIYHLRNAQATNLELVLNTLFGNVQNGQNQGQQPGQNPNGGPNGGRNGNAFGNAGGNGRGLGSNNNGQTGANRNQQANRTGSNRQRLSPGMAQAANSLTGEVFVVADEDTNSLIITTATKYEKQVREIIAELDRAVPQVLLKVLVAEVTHDNSADFGTDFSILNTRANGLGQGFGQTFGNPGSGLVVSFVESKLNAQLHALAQNNKLDVLSRPYILTSDNQAAEILVGQEVPLVQSNYTTDLGQIISNYQYQKVGIIVDVTPHINPDGLVTLDVAPEISALSSQSVNVGPNISAPVIDDRSASSRVAIRDGQTIVIGGLMQDQKTLTVNKVPILGDIPLIGLAFSRTQVSKTKTELLIFLTPHVAQVPEQLETMSEDETQGTRLTPNAVAPGTFQEHMRGLRRGAAPATRPTDTIRPFNGDGGDSGAPQSRPAAPPPTRPADAQPEAGDATNVVPH